MTDVQRVLDLQARMRALLLSADDWQTFDQNLDEFAELGTAICDSVGEYGPEWSLIWFKFEQTSEQVAAGWDFTDTGSADFISLLTEWLCPSYINLMLANS